MKSGRKHLRARHKKGVYGERGMTLVELLAAMTISAILLTVVLRFFVTQSQSYIKTRQKSEMQQELRWAINYVSDHVKLAGNGVPPTCGWPIISNKVAAYGDSDSLAVLGSYKSLVITTTTAMTNPGSQIMVDQNDGVEVGDLCVISDGTHQEIFMVTKIVSLLHIWHEKAPPWNDDGKLDHAYTFNSSVTVVTHYSFYVDMDDEGRINLMVLTQAYDPQILIGDIDFFQIRFRMKDDTWLDEPDQEEIYDIRMIEITIRARSPEPLKGYIDPEYGDEYQRIEMKSIVIPKNITII